MERMCLDATHPQQLSHGQLPGSLELAYLGDTVYDLFVRGRVVARGGRMKALHKEASLLVCAHAQSEAMERVMPLLTEQERDVCRRARNAKQSPPRNADPGEYHRATALEALIGFLYFTGQIERLDTLMRAALGGPTTEIEGDANGI